MEHVIETVGLTKRFGSETALDRVDLKVRRPSIVGLLGKNGSGKTTLIQHLMGLQLPDEGSVTTLDRPSDKLGHEELIHIGYVPQEIRLLDWMTVEQHIRYVSCFYPAWDKEREQRLLQELELDATKVVGTLSSGDLQKLAIILAVCHHPNLLLLDEPVSDLDPIARGTLLEFLLELLREEQATILVSTHVLRDVEKIVDWVVSATTCPRAFRAGLVDAAFFIFILGLGLYLIGHRMGLLVGYEPRFGFMPFYFRVLMVTMILMPLGHWGRFQLQAAKRRKVDNSVVAVCVFLSPRILVNPAVELATLSVALLVSQLIYRHNLVSYYRTVDLA